MSPMIREYLGYLVAVLVGFGVYLGLDRGLGIDFAFALLGGFVAIHATLVIIRRFFPPS